MTTSEISDSFGRAGGEVNWLIDGFCGRGLPTINLAHADTPGGKHHRDGVGRRQHGLGFVPPLELLVQPLDRVGCAYAIGSAAGVANDAKYFARSRESFSKRGTQPIILS
jgi:hypothetical protein